MTKVTTTTAMLMFLIVLANSGSDDTRQFVMFKVLSRIAYGISFEQQQQRNEVVVYASESQRTLCLAELFDVFAAACPDRQTREFLQRIAAPTWGVTAELAVRYIESR